MLEMLEHLFKYILIFAGILGVVYAKWVESLVRKDISHLSELTRCLFRSGKVNTQVLFSYKSFDLIWRKLLAFYYGVSRSTKVKTDAETFILGSLDLVNASSDSKKVLQVLTDIILKTSAPESRFVGLAEKSKDNATWSVSASSGISRSRLEDPFLLALNNLPIQNERTVIYTSPQNGIDFDFRGLGVGLSLFVSILNQKELIGMVWVGLSEELGVISDTKREMLELIVQHAVSTFITARKSEEKNKKSEDQKDKILALSHDLKAPSIRAIYALRELKSSATTLTSESLALVSEIECAIDEQLGLIGELFDVDSSMTNQNVNEVEIVGLIKSRIDAFRIVARSVNLEIRVGNLQRAKVRMPKDVLSRILDNLLSNAIKYTHSGYVKISSESVGSKLEIKVEDTGPGVRPDLLPFLFSSNMRQKDKLENSGQGFGLTVVKKLLEDFGASVSYSEKLGGGSVFTILLPVITFLESANSHLKNNRTVLIVDDDPIVRNVHQKWIKSLVDKVLIAGSFSEAASILEFNTPSLIITDLNIPNESLYDFTGIIPPATKVVVLTGESKQNLDESFLSMNFYKIIEKPIEKGELRELVESVMNEIPIINKYEKAA
jgi:signal transduction histidine kinase